MHSTCKPLFTGCATALVTPMLKREDGALAVYTPPEIDYDSFKRLVRRQLAAGVDALVICGTTGESPTLTDEEKRELFSIAMAESRRHREDGGRHIPIIAGSGSNNTRRAVELSRIAERAGCDGLLVVTPYYNKANGEGLVAHYAAVAGAVSLPILAYHVPGRTGCRLTPETCRKLSRLEQVVGLKDATGDMGFAARVAAVCGDALPLYSGCDDSILPLLALGGQGVVSVVSNLYPERVVALCRAHAAGDRETARHHQLDLLPLCDALFSDINPIPIKAALAARGLCSDALRLPLTAAGEEVRRRVREAAERVE